MSQRNNMYKFLRRPAVVVSTKLQISITQIFLHAVKHYFFRRILISQFPHVENSQHFNLADFPLNYIEQFAFRFFWCLYQILHQNSYRIIVYITYLPRILHIYHRSVDILCSKVMVMGSSKILRVFNFAKI